jgi:ABC-2 type transport system permease protein
VTQAARQLFGNIPANTPEPTAWPLQHPAEYTLIWTVPILVITIPVANAQHRVSTSR